MTANLNLPTVHNFKVSQSRSGVVPVVTFKRASPRIRLTLRYGYGNDNDTVTARVHVAEFTASVLTENERKCNRRLGWKTKKLN